MIKVVMTGPMDITVLTTVVVTVLIILNVTYTLDTVTGGVSPDIPTVTVAKSVCQDIMERTASIVVVDTVKTMSRVTISVGLAQEVVKMVSTEHIVTNLALKDILARAVRRSVHLTVFLPPVDKQTDRVLPVLQDGLVIIVLQHAMCLLERYVSISVMFTVSTRRVTKKAAVCMVVKMDTNVLMILQQYGCLFRKIYLQLSEARLVLVCL